MLMKTYALAYTEADSTAENKHPCGTHALQNTHEGISSKQTVCSKAFYGNKHYGFMYIYFTNTKINVKYICMSKIFAVYV